MPKIIITNPAIVDNVPVCLPIRPYTADADAPRIINIVENPKTKNNAERSVWNFWFCISLLEEPEM